MYGPNNAYDLFHIFAFFKKQSVLVFQQPASKSPIIFIQHLYLVNYASEVKSNDYEVRSSTYNHMNVYACVQLLNLPVENTVNGERGRPF
jgi:hypothetical protein